MGIDLERDLAEPDARAVGRAACEKLVGLGQIVEPSVRQGLSSILISKCSPGRSVRSITSVRLSTNWSLGSWIMGARA